MDFTLEAMGEIVQQASTIHYISNGRFKVPFMLRAAGGGVRSTGPHHSHTFWSFFAHIPGLKVVVPSTPYDVKGLIKTGLRDENPGDLHRAQRASTTPRATFPKRNI